MDFYEEYNFKNAIENLEKRKNNYFLQKKEELEYKKKSGIYKNISSFYLNQTYILGYKESKIRNWVFDIYCTPLHFDTYMDQNLFLIIENFWNYEAPCTYSREVKMTVNIFTIIRNDELIFDRNIIARWQNEGLGTKLIGFKNGEKKIKIFKAKRKLDLLKRFQLTT